MPPSLRVPVPSVIGLTSSLRPQAQSHDPSCLVRQFSSTPTHHARLKHQSKARRSMWNWINGPGSRLKYPRKDSTNYLGAYDREGNLIRGARARAQAAEKQDDEEGAGKKTGAEGQGAGAADDQETLEDLRPFPLNPYFRSEAVLSVELRNEIYRRVVEQGQTVREVSIALQVEMSRVGAVVRLKTVEQDWLRQNKPLAQHYQTAVLKMLPQTPFDPAERRIARHESINDLPVHPSTLPQLFHPTSESRHFTRSDAGRVFHAKLLPADDRIPHPEMIATIKDRIAGMREGEQRQAQAERIKGMEEERETRKREAALMEARRTRVVEGRRWDFRFKDVRVEDAGKNGRAAGGVGWRYGFPHEDRKRGQVKIPTSVD